MFKRYICFGMYHYEPYGGMDDSQESFDTLPEAEKWIEENVLGGSKFQDGHIFDCDTRNIIE